MLPNTVKMLESAKESLLEAKRKVVAAGIMERQGEDRLEEDLTMRENLFPCFKSIENEINDMLSEKGD